MKSSHKGTKLNEIRHFRQLRPYTRKRITKMRLIPDLPGLHASVISSPKDQILLSNYPRSSEKSRDRCVTLDRDQRSREIAWIFYTSDSEDSEEFCPTKGNSQSRWRNTFVETDPEEEILDYLVEPADFVTKVGENIKVEEKLETEKEVQVELELQVEEKNIGVEEPPELAEELEPVLPEKLEVCEERQEEIVRKVRHEKPQVHSNRNSSDSERSFWLRYSSIRKILDFFGHLLGKRATENHDKEATRIVEKSVNNSSNDAKSYKTDNLMKGQAKRSTKRKIVSTRKNTSAKQPEDRVFSGLTRQIMNTRDKRLRATLMEHELRARKLEEENRRYRRILEEKLKTRQMSSPLH